MFKHISKKIISFILVLLCIFNLISASVASVLADVKININTDIFKVIDKEYPTVEGYNTIVITANYWLSANIYAWKKETLSEHSAWPGILMRFGFVNEYGQYQYFAFIPVEYDSCVISNTSLSQQTVDIDIAGNMGVYLSNYSNGLWTVGNWSPDFYDTDDLEIPPKDHDGKYVDIWPGERMNLLENTENIYYFDIPVEYNYFIFSDGNYYLGFDNKLAWQTDDILFTGGNKLYKPNLSDTAFDINHTFCSVDCSDYMLPIDNDYTRRVYFEAPSSWDHPSCFCWNSGIELENPVIRYGADRFSFGEDINGYAGEELRTLVVYDSKDYGVSDLKVTSSNPDVVLIKSVTEGSDIAISVENEKLGEVLLDLKKEGTSTITITSPEGVSESTVVTVEQVSYEIKMYSEIPTLVVGENRTIGAALQLEKNGILVEDSCNYSFVSSDTNVVTISNVRNEKDGVYFYINGHKSGVTKLTVTEVNTGAIYSTLIQVNDGIITYNAEALPTYYNREAECNGFVNGMYMDEFCSTQKNDTTLSVSFNVYNTTSLVGVVDVYDKNNKLVNTYPIKRYDGGIVSSVYETIKEGYYLIKDVVTGDILTYKQSSYSQKTEIKNIDVPVGGRIEITNDINYSDSCCILNVTELSITTILTVGDTIKGLSSSEIKKIAEESSVTILKKQIGSKLPEIASEFRKKIIKSIAEDAGDVIVADALNIVSDNALNIFESFDIDFTKLVVDSAASLGVGIAEDAFVAATAFIGATLKGMFIVADYLELSCFIMQIPIPRSDKAMKIYFDDENGCLVSNGVSIKSQNGTTDLSENNFVMHSIILSNEEDLSSEIRQTLEGISNDYVVRDIYLERDGVISQPGQTVQVYMPIPDNYDPSKCKLYWVKNDGALEQKDFTIVGDNIMFTTDHFSCWALVNGSSVSVIESQCGDVDGDNKVSIMDATMIQRHIAQLASIDEDRIICADTDGDGKVSIMDATMIQRFIAQLIPEL